MVGVSPAVVDYLVNEIHLPKKKVTLINNGVVEKPRANAERVDPLRESLNLPEDAFIIGTVGRLLDEHKRISDLIRAMPKILQHNPDARLMVVGTGPDEGNLLALVHELKVAEYVLFVGYQADSQPFYELMDVFVLASAYEAFGLVLVEAMFCEVPVVATRVGGIPGIVIEGNTGYLVERFQPAALSAAVLNLAQNPSLRRSMGQAGRKRALEHFSSERYVSDVDALYKRLLRERKLA